MSTAPGILTRERAGLSESAGGLDFFLHALARVRLLGRAPVQNALWQQVQRGALDLFWLTAALGALAGFFTVASVGVGFGLGLEVGVRVMQLLVLGQLAGFICALLLVAGPGTAATFELGLMRQQGELRTLRLIGIDPHDYLVLPRVFGFAGSLFVLSFVFQAAAVIGGCGLAALVMHLSLTQQFTALVASVRPLALVATGVRSLLLGAVIGALICEQGLAGGFTPNRMPQVARHLLSRALIALVVVHGVAALLLS